MFFSRRLHLPLRQFFNRSKHFSNSKFPAQKINHSKLQLKLRHVKMNLRLFSTFLEFCTFSSKRTFGYFSNCYWIIFRISTWYSTRIIRSRQRNDEKRHSRRWWFSTSGDNNTQDFDYWRKRCGKVKVIHLDFVICYSFLLESCNYKKSQPDWSTIFSFQSLASIRWRYI